MADEARSFFAPAAWVNGEWAHDVALSVDAGGCWSNVVASAPAPAGATHLAGAVLPGLVNGHSHAFQRAIAGLTERSQGGDDDFWSWRERMYSVANRVTPQQLEAIATFLYTELLQAGYTHVCEFHYLHNDFAGRAYASPAEMSMALVRAAETAGIGLTLLPTLYMRSGFAAKGLRDDQQRFASTPDSVLRIAAEIGKTHAASNRVTSGVAIHSLRAADAAAMKELADGVSASTPIHIHISEQLLEVEDCVAVHGRRPVEWLLHHLDVDARWNLVHATHSRPEELEGLRNQRASIVICPATEANLGDGVFDLQEWLGQSGNWSIGSDSHVNRSWQEELRLLEYSQRLTLRKRNVAAAAALSESSATALFEGALRGGAAAAGLPLGGLAVGQRADFIVVDPASPSLVGVPASHLLDAVVFSSPNVRFAQVFVAGSEVSVSGRYEEIARGMRDAMRALWG